MDQEVLTGGKLNGSAPEWKVKDNGRLALAGMLALILTLAHGSWADGIPEPNLVLYDVITDPLVGGYRVSDGIITWAFQPVAGAAGPNHRRGATSNETRQSSHEAPLP